MSLVTISGLEVQVQVYANIDKDMLQSFDTETIDGQILISNVVPRSSLQNSNMWDQYRLVNY